jgi:hypothetical protein
LLENRPGKDGPDVFFRVKHLANTAFAQENGMKTGLRITLYTMATGAALLAGSANATPLQLFISISVGGGPAVTQIYDDVNVGTPGAIVLGTPGVIDLNAAPQNLNGVLISGEIGQQTVSPLIELISTATKILNTNGAVATMQAVLSGAGYPGPATQSQISASGQWSATPGSSVTAKWFNDPANGLGPTSFTDTPGNQIGGTFVSAPATPDPLSSYSFTSSIFPLGVPDTGLFSMTEQWTYVLAPSGSLDSRGQTEIAFNIVPEPTSTLLIGTALVGLGCAARRKSRP